MRLEARRTSGKPLRHALSLREGGKPRTLGLQRHEALRKFIKDKCEKARLTQHELARLLRHSQSYVATIETRRGGSMVELVELATALGFDSAAALRLVRSIKQA
jgi:hypothetical protein